MQSIRNTPHYKNAIKEQTYPFGSFFLFDTYVVAEINKDVVFSWDHHAKKVVDELSELYEDNGENIVYITNRIHSYSVIPSDWLKFYKNKHLLKGYGVVSYTKKGTLNVILEKLFMRNKIRSFDNLEDAINWAKSIKNDKEESAA